ncbi:MAG: hypothetical protein QXN71_01460 [Candidatus Aenigmatarchaeota archaeon]
MGKLEAIWKSKEGNYKIRLIPFYVEIHNETPNTLPLMKDFNFIVEKTLENRPVEFLEIRSFKYGLYSWERKRPHEIDMSFPKYFVLMDDDILNELVPYE